MARGQLWIEVRYRLVVLGAMGLAGLGLIHGGSVHFGAPPAFRSYAVMHPYAGAITEWSPGQAVIAGWARNIDDVSCPSVLMWVHSGAQHGFLWLGPIPRGARITWAGKPGYWDPLLVHSKPTIEKFVCEVPGPEGPGGYEV